MREIFSKWIERYFSDEEALLLFLLLAAGLAIIVFLGQTLTPVFAGLIFAFLMQGAVDWLVSRKVPHLAAVTVVFLLFAGTLLAFLLIVLPAVWNQLVALFNELPRIASQLQSILLLLPERYPGIVDAAQVKELTEMATREVSSAGQWVLTFSVNSISSVVALMIYLVLVPILVFFFLKDGRQLTRWWTAYLPERRQMMTQVWNEMDDQIANYVRGKVIEIVVVGSVSYVAFAYFGLNYAALLAIMVGLSVLIPYIGAALVTLPVALIAFIQWGLQGEFIYLMTAYAIIQGLDGNVLVPLLFSDAVNLHPISIIVAVLVFGGIWGVWGVFFAIPLATLIKAILTAWPKGTEKARAVVSG